MFEKEAEECAEEYRNSDDYNSAEPCDFGYANGISTGFEKGADYVYNKAAEIIQQLIINAPNTYSGTNIELQQRKMFSFQNAVSRAEQFLKETK